MPVKVVCPECAVRLTVPDAVVGKKIKCKKCGAVFPALEAAEEAPEAPAKPRGRPGAAPAPPAPTRKPAKPKPPADDEDDEEDERPVKKKAAGKKGKKKKSNTGLLIALLGVGLVVLLGGGAATAYLLGVFDSDDQKPATSTAPAGPGGAPASSVNVVVGAEEASVRLVNATNAGMRLEITWLPGKNPELLDDIVFMTDGGQFLQSHVLDYLFKDGNQVDIPIKVEPGKTVHCWIGRHKDEKLLNFTRISNVAVVRGQ